MVKTFSRPKIKDLPISERPYEKLEKYGPAMLSDAELIAIIIRTGSNSETSVALAQRLLMQGDEDNVFSFLYDISLDELKEIKGIGRVKGIQIKAMMELAKRISSSGSSLKRITVKSPQDIADYMMPEMRYLKKEYFKAVLLNAKNDIIKVVDISIGSLTASIVHPREAFKEAVRNSSNGVIFVHNHPSGDPEPSSEDISITKRLVEAGKILGISVLDHIIIGHGRFASLKERGFI